ncbi:MAG: hypothetical protein H0U76_23340 [Ktedonobacteraceae bacterium]|nr:hypothetical protein [Ktedonobacteraceae bacterium]
MPRFDFWKKTYAEATVLERAKGHAKNDVVLQRVIEAVYFNRNASADDLAKVASDATTIVDPTRVKLHLRPQALRLIDLERAKNNEPIPAQAVGPPPAAGPGPVPPPVDTLTDPTIDDVTAQAVRAVMHAQTSTTLNTRIKKVALFVFKTFAPLSVLCLTIPESIWVFTHIYTNPDSVQDALAALFAILVDFGYLYLTILVELNKEALFRRRRAGLEIEPYERRAVRLQSLLWWVVAVFDILAQLVYLYSVTRDSLTFDPRLVLLLVVVRILSLFTTMFVVSFAGTELMTDIDIVANQEIERASRIERLLVALGMARHKQLEARQKIENMIADQDLRREGEAYLKDMYADARDEARRQREALRHQRQAGPNRMP